MSKKIITISREFGSGGRFIGEEVAKKLGMKYYDRDIIGQIAEKVGIFTGIHSGKCGIISKERIVRICFCRTRYYRKIGGRYGI